MTGRITDPADPGSGTPCEQLNGDHRSMKKNWENHRKAIGKYTTLSKNHGKTIEKWESHRKITEKWRS